MLLVTRGRRNLDAYQDAGVTWWLEGEEDVRPHELRSRIETGHRRRR
jgi:hypothetical protein